MDATMAKVQDYQVVGQVVPIHHRTDCLAFDERVNRGKVVVRIIAGDSEAMADMLSTYLSEGVPPGLEFLVGSDRQAVNRGLEPYGMQLQNPLINLRATEKVVPRQSSPQPQSVSPSYA